MLLLHQVGSVKVGEVVRYTITYTPSHDRILPSPDKLYVRLRNTCAVPLRAAFVHGPYTLSVAAYPAGFDPNEKFPHPERYGVPEFEPMVKAGGSWECELAVPDDIRQSAGTGGHGGFGKAPEHDAECASWVVEVASQVLFSTSAAVGYELVVARDRKSLSLSSSSPVAGGQAQVPQPGRVSDHQQSIGAKDGHHPAQQRGVFSPAISLKVEDTASLWNTPRLPGWDDMGHERALYQKPSADQPVESMTQTNDPETKEHEAEQQQKDQQQAGTDSDTTTNADPTKGGKLPQKQKKVHLVILTHGLHSNLGADMLFMKESIDAAARQAKKDRRERRAKERAATGETAQAPSDHAGEEYDEDDDEEVIVRGYSGNATKTERGIKYLGKRLARYVLAVTHPDQPFFPFGGKGAFDSVLHPSNPATGEAESTPSHKHSTIQAHTHRPLSEAQTRPYKITSISFIAHSLGGLVQTYAVAYVQKHSPQFFDRIKPINFIALASPYLGLSNENPLYVKFALDFGLVGRTGKDLGLAWRAPTLARSGWGAIVGNLGETAHKKVYGESQPESKPLLRILPTGPAHTALKKFRNRTVYSNVVNDGIVPLRTSCLLFLDWQGLGRVEKARRDAGLVETVVGFGWAELTGANTMSPRQKQQAPGDKPAESGRTTPHEHDDLHEVPQPSNAALAEDDRASLRSVPAPYGEDQTSDSADSSNSGPLASLFSFFKKEEPSKPPEVTNKQKMIFRRSQTINFDQLEDSSNPSLASSSKSPKVTSGHEEEEGHVTAPPKTTFFESAGDLLNPKVPDIDYLLDPSKRPRTIFHDRVYHPWDIPPPPLKRQPSTLKKFFHRTGSTQNSVNSGASSPYPSIKHEDSLASAKDYDDTLNTNPDKEPFEIVDSSSMRVEEKIARAYHRDLSWRKVLVKLEPDAHNNIFVRRMFVNAYGWPVVKHLVDTHFSDSAASRLKDDDEGSRERARDVNQPPDEHGKETKTSRDNLTSLGEKGPGSPTVRTENEESEALDQVHDLPTGPQSQGSDGHPSSASRSRASRDDSVTWSERDWADSDADSDLDFGGDTAATDKGQAAKDKGKDKEPGRSSSPLSAGWNWAEKIVGRGAGARAKSPTSPAFDESVHK